MQTFPAEKSIRVHVGWIKPSSFILPTAPGNGGILTAFFSAALNEISQG